MADSKISALPASTTPLAGTEVLPIVQSSTTKQVSVADLTAGRAVSALSLTSTTTLGVTGTSTLSGNAIISVTDNTNAALRITQLGTGDALLVEDSTNPDATPVVINNSGNVGIGTSAPNTKLEVSSLTGSATPVPTEVRISTSSIASDWSTTLPWAQLGFYSADDSRAGPKLHASIAVISDITTGGTSSLDFNTSDNTGVLSQRMRIGSTGVISYTGSLTVSAYTETIVASGTVGSTATLAITAGTVLTATLTSATACTFTMPTATAGKSFILLLKQPASGTATTATFTGVKFNASGAPTITATLGAMDILTFVADGTNWYGSYSQGYTP